MNLSRFVFCAVMVLGLVSAGGAEVARWEVFGTTFATGKTYPNAYTDVEVDVIFKQGEQRWKMPAYWVGAGNWTVRFAPRPQLGRVEVPEIGPSIRLAALFKRQRGRLQGGAHAQ